MSDEVRERFEIPKEMRSMAEASVEQARKTFEKFAAAAQTAAGSIEERNATVRAGANRGVALLDGAGGGLRRADEFLKSLAGLLDARFRYRSHFLGYLESVSHFVTHGALLCVARDLRPDTVRVPRPGRMRRRGGSPLNP